MKIIHLIDDLKVGGTQTHLLTMVTAISSLGDTEHEVWSLIGDGEIGAKLRALGVPVKVFNFGEAIRRRQLLKITKVLRDELEARHPDAFEAHLTWSRLTGLTAAWQASIPRRIGFEKGDIYLANWKFRILNAINQFAANMMIVPSSAHKQWAVRNFGFLRHRTRVLHNCVDTSKFAPTSGSRPEIFPVCRFVTCGVGTLGRGVNKRFDVLIRAVASTRAKGVDLGLVIVGDGELRESLQDLVQSLGLQESIHLLGARSDVPQIMAACDFFSHSAPYEPFGIVAIEALACGLPIIVPDSGGIREIVEPGTTGLTYEPLDVAELSQCMASMCNDEGSRNRMRAAARTAAECRFSTESYARTMINLYRTGLLS